MRILAILGAALTVICAPVAAQDNPALERAEAARVDLNESQNELAQARYDLGQIVDSDIPAELATDWEKIEVEARLGELSLRRALYAIDKLIAGLEASGIVVPNGPPTALIMGQSHAVNYGAYWSGRIRKDNPQIVWLDAGMSSDEDFVQSGSRVDRFEGWADRVIALDPDYVFVSTIPWSFIRDPDRYGALFKRLTDSGIKVITNQPWPDKASMGAEDARQAAIGKLDQWLADGTIAAIARHADDPILGAMDAWQNPTLFRDEVHHTELFADWQAGLAGGHGFAYNLWSTAWSTIEPSVTPYPYPQVTDAHRSAKPPVAVVDPLKPVVGPEGYVQLAAVDDGLDLSTLLGNRNIPKSGVPDVVGAFRFWCTPGPLVYADPIVFFGKQGMSHLHSTFGNTNLSENSTYESLRESGDSTCRNEGNRSAYWVPAVIGKDANDNDVVIQPDRYNIYYKRRPKSDPYYAENGVTPIDIPRGLRMVFGGPPAASTGDGEEGLANFKCVTHDGRPNPKPGKGDAAMQAILAACDQPGDAIYAVLATPQCWDGKNLDAPDHRSHVAGHEFGSQTGWVKKCNTATYPFEISKFWLHTKWIVQEGDRPETWAPSSGAMVDSEAGEGPWDSWHADWFGAWNDEVLERWHANCIDKLLSCNDGDLGDGQGLNANDRVRNRINSNERVPVPANAAMQH